MKKVDIAGKRLKIGLKMREIGDPVPEAILFNERNRKAMLNTGHLKEVPLDSLSDEQRDKYDRFLENLKPRHVGGGLYELPTGDRIRGKKAAYQKMGLHGFHFAND